MSELPELDLSELRRVWDERRSRAEEVLQRIDPRGLRRPARTPEERAWLEARGELGPFVEDEACARAAREYYGRRYGGAPG